MPLTFSAKGPPRRPDTTRARFRARRPMVEAHLPSGQRPAQQFGAPINIARRALLPPTVTTARGSMSCLYVPPHDTATLRNTESLLYVDAGHGLAIQAVDGATVATMVETHTSMSVPHTAEVTISNQGTQPMRMVRVDLDVPDVPRHGFTDPTLVCVQAAQRRGPAPDGSAIDLLAKAAAGLGGLCVATLPAGCTSTAIQHRSIDELWYVQGGSGTLWRGTGTCMNRAALHQGDCLSLVAGVPFQFASSEHEPLRMVLATMPQWPGPREVIYVRPLTPPTRRNHLGYAALIAD